MATEKTNVVTELVNRTVVVSRVFDAPRTLVFKAFSTPEHLAQWWGPKGWTLPVCTVDFRPSLARSAGCDCATFSRVAAPPPRPRRFVDTPAAPA